MIEDSLERGMHLLSTVSLQCTKHQAHNVLIPFKVYNSSPQRLICFTLH